MQLPTGAVSWALRPDGTPDGTALLTGNASLFKALRCGVALAELVRVVVLPSAASYPARPTNRPSAEMVINPSLVAVPLANRGRFAPLTAVGAAIDCTSAPAGVYSSTKTELPVLASVCVPSPTR